MVDKVMMEKYDELILNIKTILSLTDLLSCTKLSSLFDETMDFISMLIIKLCRDSLEILDSFSIHSQEEEGKR